MPELMLNEMMLLVTVLTTTFLQHMNWHLYIKHMHENLEFPNDLVQWRTLTVGMMDFIFGVNSMKCLVYIIMDIDPHSWGIPLAFIVFIPLKHALAAHALYDGAILNNLLTWFKLAMRMSDDSKDYKIYVVNTDNDPHEWNSLTIIWSNIFLLRCLFHVWQVWWNGLIVSPMFFLRVLHIKTFAGILASS
jgi:hypothetical protein